MPIIPQLMENSSKEESFLSQFTKILLVVWSANGNGSALTTSKLQLLSDDTYRCVCPGNCIILYYPSG